MKLSRPLVIVIAAALLFVTLFSTVFAETYRIRPGDTMWGIATRFGVTVSDLAQTNGIDNPDLIYVDQELTIPGSESAESSADPEPSEDTESSEDTEPSEPVEPELQPATATATVPSGGPGSIMAKKRIVSYYGNPLAGQMGVLGRYDPEVVVAKLKEQAEEYARLSDRPVQAALHMVVTVAQAGPGRDGMYRLRMDDELIEEWADLAERHGVLFIIDIQVGRATVYDEVNAMRHFLERPNVHLALDPEFDMGPSQFPGQQIGSTDARHINWATDFLADIVAEHNLPNKILIVHQFMDSMITNKSSIKTDPRVDIVIDIDGFGGQAAKISKYNHFQSEPVQFAGIKLFYREDYDLLTPEQIMQLSPTPDFIVYQ